MKLSTHSSVLNHLALLMLSSLALGGCAGKVTSSPESTSTQSSADSEDNELPPIPAALAVPAGNRLFFHLDAVGVQIYTCAASGSSFAWKFVAPQANLYNRGGEVVAIHYKGPTWQWLEDGSTVVGSKLAAVTPDPTAIPWLLLGAVSHSGEGRMTRVSYVQRLETVGGNAPASGCDATTVGNAANVPYTATYAFYAPSNGEDDNGGHGGGDDGNDDSP